MTRGSAAASWRDGMRRVAAAPAIVAAGWGLSLLVSVPLALAMRSLLEQHLGASMAADLAASGVNLDWMQEFAIQARGLGSTFTPTILGFGAVLDNVSTLADHASQPIILAAAAAVYIGLWLFAAGGIIDRYARNRPTHAYGFFAVSGAFFFRFLRLAAIMLAVYGAAFTSLHPFLFGRLYPAMTRGVTVERTAFAARLGLYLVFAVLLGACNLVFDYAKVRAVVEDRRSMIGAVIAALRFVGRNPGGTIALYLLDVLLFAIALAVYAVIAPGAGRTGWTMWAAFAIGQAYILARLWVKLVFWASETSLFQSRLAHAGYVAAPAPRWPDAPIIESLEPAP